MSFFEELKRRNVFRVGMAYIFVTWGLAQAADLALENFGAPGWIMRSILVVFFIGFPLALFLAWAFEVTPEGVKAESEVDRSQSVTPQTGKKLDRMIIVALVFAVGFLLYKQSTIESDIIEATQVLSAEQTPETGEATDLPTIAVLPFVNMSSDPEQEYFSDGITEEILNRLAKLDGLQVAARTSVFSFKDRNLDIREVADMLGVSNVLEGSVRRDGELVRITAQLIRASDGFHLWSETYDREIESIFAVQDEISKEIASALKVSLGISDTPAGTNSPTTSAEVYDLYLRAKALHRKRGPGLLTAMDMFKQALAIDPEFAPAWAGLSHTLNVLPAYASLEEMEQIGDARAQSMAAAQKALELDPDLTTALHAMANNQLARFEWSEAQKYYLQALSQDLESTDILEDYGHFLLYSWQTKKAKQVADRMIALDPYVPAFLFMAIGAYEVLGESEKQDAFIAAALGLSPDFTNIQTKKLARLLEDKRSTDANAYIDQMNLQDWTTPASMHRMVDWTFDLEMPLDEEMSSALSFFPTFALVSGRYKLWGEQISVNTFHHWENVLGTVSVLSSTANEERFRQLNALPQSKALIREARLPEYWNEIGWPPRCRPIGGDDFVCE